MDWRGAIKMFMLGTLTISVARANQQNLTVCNKSIKTCGLEVIDLVLNILNENVLFLAPFCRISVELLCCIKVSVRDLGAQGRELNALLQLTKEKLKNASIPCDELDNFLFEDIPTSAASGLIVLTSTLFMLVTTIFAFNQLNVMYTTR